MDLDRGEFSVHECASVLKTFLSELPEPLLSDRFFHAHCQVANKLIKHFAPNQNGLPESSEGRRVSELTLYKMIGKNTTPGSLLAFHFV